MRVVQSPAAAHAAATKYITIHEMAARLGVTVDAVRARKARDGYPADLFVHHGRRLAVDNQVLDRYIAELRLHEREKAQRKRALKGRRGANDSRGVGASHQRG